jgi:hypothetical protein
MSLSESLVNYHSFDLMSERQLKLLMRVRNFVAAKTRWTCLQVPGSRVAQTLVEGIR